MASVMVAAIPVRDCDNEERWRDMCNSRRFTCFRILFRLREQLNHYQAQQRAQPFRQNKKQNGLFPSDLIMCRMGVIITKLCNHRTAMFCFVSNFRQTVFRSSGCASCFPLNAFEIIARMEEKGLADSRASADDAVSSTTCVHSTAARPIT